MPLVILMPVNTGRREGYRLSAVRRRKAQRGLFCPLNRGDRDRRPIPADLYLSVDETLSACTKILRLRSE